MSDFPPCPFCGSTRIDEESGQSGRERDVIEQRAGDISAMLGRMVYATRHVKESRVVSVRNDAVALIRKLGASNPLRTEQEKNNG